jgi:hypothetical protein
MNSQTSRFELACRGHLAVGAVNLIITLVLFLPVQFALSLALGFTPTWQDAFEITFLAVSLWIYSPWQKFLQIALKDKDGKILSIVGPYPTPEQLKRRDRK